MRAAGLAGQRRRAGAKLGSRREPPPPGPQIGVTEPRRDRPGEVGHERRQLAGGDPRGLERRVQRAGRREGLGACDPPRRRELEAAIRRGEDLEDRGHRLVEQERVQRGIDAARQRLGERAQRRGLRRLGAGRQNAARGQLRGQGDAALDEVAEAIGEVCVAGGEDRLDGDVRVARRSTRPRRGGHRGWPR